MSLTAEMVTASFKAMRSALSGSVVPVRHNRKTYDATRCSLDSSETVTNMGAIEGADGAVRLCVSELKKPHPKPGETIEIKNQESNKWETLVILTARYDQLRATFRIDYEAQYA